MHKSIFFVCALLAVAASQGVNNFQLNGSPIQVSANQTYTTSFDDYLGSQFAVWIPSNVSRIFLNWTRSAEDSNGCDYYDYAYLYGKWGTFPCYGYDSISAQCEYNYDNFGYSYYDSIDIVLDAYDASDLEYWTSGSYGSDFIRGDWLYLDSHIDVSASNCTASLFVSFDYCPVNTIAAYQKNGGNGYDTTCVSYTNVTGTTFTQNGVLLPSGTSKYYLLNVPANSSGIVVYIENATYYDLDLYARPSSGGGYWDYYAYQSTYEYSDGGFYNYSFWVPNPSAGEWVFTIEDYYSTTGDNWTFDLQLMIKSCPPGYAADDDGACLYQLTPVSAVELSAATLNLAPYNSAIMEDCSWAFYSYYTPANSFAYLNITFTLPTYGYVYWRKNAVPSYSYYDDSTSSTGTVYFTPEDFAANKAITWYFGFCNYDSTANGTFTVAASSFLQPSALPSPSSTPAVGASPSPGSSSGEDSSSAFSLAVSMFLVLACVVLMF